MLRKVIISCSSLTTILPQRCFLCSLKIFSQYQNPKDHKAPFERGFFQMCTYSLWMSVCIKAVSSSGSTLVYDWNLWMLDDSWKLYVYFTQKRKITFSKSVNRDKPLRDRHLNGWDIICFTKQLSRDSKKFHLKYTKELIARKPPWLRSCVSGPLLCSGKTIHNRSLSPYLNIC